MSDISHDLICTHDLDGRLLSVNAAAARILGVEVEDLVGSRIQDILLPSVRIGFDDYIQSIRTHGTADGSMVVRTIDGRIRTWEYHNTIDENGIVCGLARDMTERDVALRALRESEEHFRSIIENVSDVITIIDPDATIRYSSPSITAVLGYQPEEMSGRSFFDLVDEADQIRAINFLERQSVSGAASTIELHLRHRDGSLRDVEVLAKTLRRGTHVEGVIATTRDITDRRLLETQLKRAERLASLGRLAATVAHEFNNVLMGMQPFAELMQRDGSSRETVTKGAMHIANSIARGKRIVQDILRFTQPAEPILRSLHLAEWWEALLPEIEALTANDIDVVTDFPPEPLFVLADAAQLTQVITNLVTNARDAMPNGGTITVRARRPSAGETYPFGVVREPESFIQISVSDTGTGIAPNILQQIFEPLFTSKPSGTGLGLAVAHQVVMRHGGSIFVESVVDRGTTFHLFLRGGEAAIDVGARHSCLAGQTKMSGPHLPLRTRKLMMVDDEPTIIEGVAALLRDENFVVSTVTSGEAALDAVLQFEPDIVLLDVGLPGMDGVETSRRLRAVRPSLPIIFSSGHDAGEAADARTRYLQKPFALTALLDAIAALEASA